VEFALDLPLASRLLVAAGLDGDAVAVTPLTGGVTCAVYAVRTRRADVVMKIHPRLSAPEIEKELWVAQLLAARAPDLPVPPVLGADRSGAVIPHDVLVLRKLDGVNLRSLVPTLGATELEALHGEIGGLLRELHRIAPAEFGNLGPERRRGYSTNLEFMVTTFDSSLRAFETLGGDPRLRRRLAAHVHERTELFARCARPVFCHNDAHDANVLVADAGDGRFVSGLIDFEHAIAAAPAFDLARTYYFSEGSSERTLAALVDGYGLAGHWRDEFDLYLLHHRLELWNLLARLGVTDRLPSIAAELAEAVALKRDGS
jgi:Ser/Thr protein kinase RdoA (MazF antagonist)